MPRDNWVALPIATKLYENVAEESLGRALAAQENAYITEADAVARFPGLKVFKALPDSGRAYLGEYTNDLIAATSTGRVYRIDQNANAEDVTGDPVTGGGRVIMAATDRELMLAAGARLVRFNGDVTETVADDDAPLASHVAHIDGYVLANEKNSPRFQNSELADARTWDPLDTFSADGTPDNISALLVTPFREVMICGPKSVEQWERSTTGTVPLRRRWGIAAGVLGPYVASFADNALIVVNEQREVVRVTAQVVQPIGDDIGKVLEAIDDWTDAWLGSELHLKGQKFIVLQIPNATTPYGTKGLTYLFDYRAKRWLTIYGWDAEANVPARWPGWSYYKQWGRTFVGGDGVIYEFDLAGYSNAGQLQRWLVRTAHLSDLGEVEVANLRMHIKRGIGSNETEPTIGVRCRRDNKRWSRWVRRGLGLAGDHHMTKEFGGFGPAYSHQFEIAVTDDCEVELVRAEANVHPVGF